VRAVAQLQKQGGLPEHVIGSVKLFQEIRNRIIHGGTATDEEILRAIDSGVMLLKAIDAIPVEINTMHRINVPLYADAGCTQPVQGARGLMLETTSPAHYKNNSKSFPPRGHVFRSGGGWHGSGTWVVSGVRPGTEIPIPTNVRRLGCNRRNFVGRHLDDV
jgi:hypothetical protein